MRPVVAGLERRYAGRVAVRVEDTSSDATAAALAAKAGVQYVPTFVFVDGSGARRDTIVGQVSTGTLAEKLDALE